MAVLVSRHQINAIACDQILVARERKKNAHRSGHIV